MEDTAVLDQLRLINELDAKKNTLLKLIETYVSKKRSKDYLQKILLRYSFVLCYKTKQLYNKKPTATNGGFFIVAHGL